MRFWRNGWAAFAVIAFAAEAMRRLVQSAARFRRPTVTTCVTPYGCPLPGVVHRRVENAKPGRLIIVGDCHGTPELFTLLDTLRYDARVDNLVLCGDLINKGPVSLQVLDALPGLGCWAVRGNHDDAVLSAWLRFRSGQGMNPKFEWARAMTDRQAAVLMELPFTVSLEEYGIAVVHAGFVPGVPVEEQDLWAMYKMRNVVREQAAPTDANGTASAPSAPSAGEPSRESSGPFRLRAVEKAKEGGEPWAAMWAGPPHVFFGHDARRRLQLHPHATGLDTGCVYGGELTAAVIPPLAELRTRSPGFVEKMRTGRTVGREDLLVELVSVAAAATYAPPSVPQQS